MRVSASVAALAAAVTTTSAADAASSGDCASGLWILVARGSLEAPGEGLTGTLADKVIAQIPGSKAVAVKYPATETDPIYFDSEDTGAKNAKQMVEDYSAKCPDSKIALMGWSQGGQVMMDLLCGGASEEFGDEAPLDYDQYKNTLVAITVFGDPTHVKGKPYDVGTSTNDGLFDRNNTSQCDKYDGRLQSYCDKGDVYCDLGNDQSVHSSYFTKYDDDIVDFIVSQYRKMSGSASSNTTTTSSSNSTMTATMSGTSGSSGMATVTASVTSSAGSSSSTPGSGSSGSDSGSGSPTNSPAPAAAGATVQLSKALVLGLPLLAALLY